MLVPVAEARTLPAAAAGGKPPCQAIETIGRAPDTVRLAYHGRTPMDALSLLLSRFPVRARLLAAGRLDESRSFAGAPAGGHLHVVETGSVSLDHGPAPVLEGPSLLWLPGGEPHALAPEGPGPARVLSAAVRLGDAGAPALLQALPPLLRVPLERLPGAAALLALLTHEVQAEAAGAAGAQAALDRLCELLLLQLLRHALEQRLTSSGTLAALADARLGKALAAIHREPGRDWELAGMAAEAGLSRARFAARFRALTGQSPGEYLAGWRIATAQHLLRSGRAMKQVSLEAGYASSSAFSRAFARRVGMPPTRWLKLEDLRER